jgi:hypothetical protein
MPSVWSSISRSALATACRIKMVDLDDTLYRLGRYYLIQSPTRKEVARYRELLSQYLRLLRAIHEIQEHAHARGFAEPGHSLWSPLTPRRLATSGSFIDMRRYF